jgi:ribonuclease E
MTKRMLIDSSHRDDTRVVVVSGNRLEEFDYETTARQQLKGNIYLAKITRVEPSLQAAFVEYGGNRHGFLPFSEIHPDYYRIPIADREALAAEEATLRGDGAGDEDDNGDPEEPPREDADQAPAAADGAGDQGELEPKGDGKKSNGEAVEQVEVESRVDTLGGDEADDDRRRRARLMRRYKIQEVIKRRQVILVQVTKEERGTKGAALTTYLSLAGRYCVLMPNTARGGGISRKIGNASDRRRLKTILSDLSIPDGMAVIVRTAGSQRSKAEIKRDYEYLLRLWSEIRETTLQSTAPCLIYEEANLIKRSIRDLYSRDMDEVLIAGDDGYKAAKAFMRSIMPSHAKNVHQYKDPNVPLFHQFEVEGQLDAMHSPVVQLKSGGYIVMNSTEALVAIDVNSGRATKERHIEETALKTNLEAAEEVARQLRLRDLAGLIVVDFIDMEASRHNREVERKLREAMRSDRARIQLGRISPFGLLELSRQRLRPSLFESSTDLCPQCGGTGHVRSIASSALAVLRNLEQEGLRAREGEIRVSVPTPVALYLLNQLRARMVEVELRYAFRVHVQTDDDLVAPDSRLERLVPGVAATVEARSADDDTGRKRRRRRRKGEDEPAPAEPRAAESEPASEPSDEEEAIVAAPDDGAEEPGDRKKTRRRRGKRGGRRRSRRRSETADVIAEQTPGDAIASNGEDAEAPAAETTAEMTAAAAEDVTAEDGTVAEAVPDSAEAAPETTNDSAAATRPKRPRRRRKAPAKAKAAAPEPETAEGVEPVASVEADGEAQAPKARTRTRKTPAKRTRKTGTAKPRTRTARSKKESPEPATETPDEAAVGKSQSDGQPRPDDSAAAPPPEPRELPAAAAPPEAPTAGDDDDLPKRRGWWQRWA